MELKTYLTTVLYIFRFQKLRKCMLSHETKLYSCVFFDYISSTSQTKIISRHDFIIFQKCYNNNVITQKIHKALPFTYSHRAMQENSKLYSIAII